MSCPIKFVISIGLMVMAMTSHALELMTENDPPHNMIKNEKVVGISTEKIEEILKRTHSQASIKLVPWAQAYQAALDQTSTCVFSTARTSKRENLFKWIGPLAAMDWVIYTRTDNLGKQVKFEDLRNEPIGGYHQDVISVWLKDQGYQVDVAPNDSVNPKKLIAGNLNYWASSKPRASALLAAEGLTEKIVPILTFGRTDLYLACNSAIPDKTVKEWNDILKRMGEDGTTAKIEARYARWPKE